MKVETLADTVDLMLSDDYKNRLYAEYHQLRIRRDKLHNYVKNLNRDSSKEYDLLRAQLKVMEAYLIILEARFDFEYN